MKRIPAILATLLVLLVQQAVACSTFFINHNGQMVFGRNYDWIAGTGMVCTNLRGLAKTSFPMTDGGTISWTSRYGSLTFNQYGKEFPTGGMNEKGLVVELMWLDETKYPAQDERPAISVLQWIQYQLDNCATIEEVIATDKTLRITTTSTPLHYLVADANGNAATIEFLEGKMVVHKGSELTFPVLTNSVYAESAQHARYAMAQNEAGGGAGSLERFATACKMIKEYQANQKTSIIDHSFNILKAVNQGSYTRWSIVYDITNKKVYFKTNEAPQVKSVQFSAFRFSCAESPLFFDMNQPVKGDVSASFRLFNEEVNMKLLRETAELSKSEVSISAGTQALMASYADQIRCK
jgi:penicillin V acylase-like amidase (Ntn superfamily)